MKNASERHNGWNGIFATRLRELMNEPTTDGKKITQEMVAEFVGTKRQTIGQYADGSVLPNLDKIDKIARFFNVSADYLLGLTGSKSLDIDDKAISAASRLNWRGYNAS